jgi:hypothetical protein
MRPEPSAQDVCERAPDQLPAWAIDAAGELRYHAPRAARALRDSDGSWMTVERRAGSALERRQLARAVPGGWQLTAQGAKVRQALLATARPR